MVVAIIIAVVTTTIIIIFLSSLGEFGVISDCFGKENLNEIDPSNPPPCKVLPGGIFYTEDEVCLFQYI